MNELERRKLACQFASKALDGALEMSDYDPVMMSWPQEEHENILNWVRAIRDQLALDAKSERLPR